MTPREPSPVFVALSRAVIHTIADRLTVRDGVAWTLTIEQRPAAFRATLAPPNPDGVIPSAVGMTEGAAICTLAGSLLCFEAERANEGVQR